MAATDSPEIGHVAYTERKKISPNWCLSIRPNVNLNMVERTTVFHRFSYPRALLCTLESVDAFRCVRRLCVACVCVGVLRHTGSISAADEPAV